MRLRDQLTELRRGFLRDRSDLLSGDSDSLWEDSALLRYIQDAERRFARRTFVLLDGTTAEYCRVTLRTGVRDYPLHPLVFAVVSGRVEGQTSDLLRSGRVLVQPQVRPSALDLNPAMPDTTVPGAPIAYYTDETAVYALKAWVTVSIFPVPSADADGTVVNFRVIRLPRGGYTKDDGERESEIPEDYQLDVLHWAAYRALSAYDGDAGSPGGADRHRAAFEVAVSQAIRETKRKTFVVGGIRYGTNGFTWGR